MSSCPACGQADLLRGSQSVDLAETLAGWEAATQARFPARLWERCRKRGRTVLHTCPACRFARFEPVVAGDTDFYSAIETDGYYNAEKWEFERAIRYIIRSGARSVLDVGCGSGHFLAALRNAAPGLRIVGSELESSVLADVRAKGFETMEGDLGSVACSPERFDIVCAFQTLEHVEDPVRFLSCFLSLVAPGGRVILSTPDADGPIRHFPDALTEVPPHHVTRWTGDAFQALLPALGFEVLTVERESLPAYLLDAYLPIAWDEGCWPADILNPLAEALGESALAFGSECIREAKLPRLYGVSGHTILVIGRRGS